MCRRPTWSSATTAAACSAPARSCCRPIFASAAASRRRCAPTARESLAFRKRTQPLESASAGCIFQNPDPARRSRPRRHPAVRRGAGRSRGPQGRARSGAARVSPTHGNFIVNEGGASAADIRALIERCRSRCASGSASSCATKSSIWDSDGETAWTHDILRIEGGRRLSGRVAGRRQQELGAAADRRVPADRPAVRADQRAADPRRRGAARPASKALGATRRRAAARRHAADPVRDGHERSAGSGAGRTAPRLGAAAGAAARAPGLGAARAAREATFPARRTIATHLAGADGDGRACRSTSPATRCDAPDGLDRARPSISTKPR